MLSRESDSPFSNARSGIYDKGKTIYNAVLMTGLYYGRVEMLEAGFPDKRFGRCNDMFHVTGIRNNQLEPKCGTLTGKKCEYWNVLVVPPVAREGMRGRVRVVGKEGGERDR